MNHFTRIILACFLLFIISILFACDSPPKSPTPVPFEYGVQTESVQSEVYTFEGNNTEGQLLPVEQIKLLTTGDRVKVNDQGRAILIFTNTIVEELRVLLFKEAKLDVEVLNFNEDKAVAQFYLEVGTLINGFDVKEDVKDRLLKINTDFAEITAIGTKFIVVRELNTPLVWAAGLEAEPNDLFITADNDSQTIETNFARWAAPIDPPSEAIPFDRQRVEEWLIALENGDPGQPELGDIIWGPADVVATANLLETLPAPGTPFRIYDDALKGVVEFTLNSTGISGTPTYGLEDCNGNGKNDIFIKNGQLQMDFRLIRARTRALDVTVLNRTDSGSGRLVAYNPAGRVTGEVNRQALIVGPNQGEVLSLRTDQIYHYADLELTEGCFLGFSLTPPPPAGGPSTPRAVSQIPAGSTPTSPVIITPATSETPASPPVVTPPTDTPSPTITPPPECPTAPTWKQYIIQVGDTWERLARRVNSSVYDLQQVNLSRATLQPGQAICLPFIPPTLTPTPVLGPTDTSTPTATRTPINELRLISCQATPNQIEIAAISPQSGLRIDIFCIGENLHSNVQGFQAELIGPIGISLDIQSSNDTGFTAVALTSPSNLQAGVYDVLVINPDGQFDIERAVFEVIGVPPSDPPPFISTVIPATGPNDQITLITVIGENFKPNQADFKAQLIGPGGIIELIVNSGGTPTQFNTSIPRDLEPGEYDLRVINPDLQSALLQRVYTVTGKPDLLVSINGPTIANPGETIPVQLIVTNQGDAVAEVNDDTPIFVSAFISADPDLGKDDVELTRRAVDTLAAGESRNIPEFFVTIPTGWLDDTAYIGAIVDSFDLILELNEDNNTATFNIQIIQPPPIISNVSPSSGLVSKNVRLTIQGENFQPQADDFTVQLEKGNSSPILLAIDRSRPASNTSFEVLIRPNTVLPDLYDLRVTNPDGQSDIKFNAYEANGLPSLSGRIAFHSTRDTGETSEIYVMNPDGSGVTRLTNNNATDWLPSWSFDGTRITFVSERDGNDEIYVMNADGSKQTRLTTNSATDSYPTWSPDGTRIAFHSDRTGETSEIYVMNPDGSGVTRLTNNNATDYYPSWSSDGTRIVFVSYRDGNSEIYVMNADGSKQTRLTTNNTITWNPSWSPTEDIILFQAGQETRWEIYVMNIDGSNQTNLTKNPGQNWSPAWSPDGKYITFSANRNGNYEIYVMNKDGSSQTNLTNNSAFDQSPSWGP